MTSNRGSYNGDDLLHSDLAAIYRAPRMAGTQVAQQRHRLEGYVDGVETPLKRTRLTERARDFFSVIGVAVTLLCVAQGCFVLFLPQLALPIRMATDQNAQQVAVPTSFAPKVPANAYVSAPTTLAHAVMPVGQGWKEVKPDLVFGLSPAYPSKEGASKQNAASVAGVGYTGSIIQLPTMSKATEVDAGINTAATGGSVLHFSLGCDDASAGGSSAHLTVTGYGGVVLGDYDARRGDAAQEVEIPLHGSSVVRFAASPRGPGQCYLDILSPATR